MKMKAIELEAELFEDMTLDAFPELELYGMKRAEDITFRELDGGTNVEGRYNTTTKEIYIAMDADNLTATLCHELIHFYELELQEYTGDATLQFLTLKLWQKLTPQIASLDTLIERHMESGGFHNLMETGGIHDVCFLLKSFDVDLRSGWKLGTTFGYDYDRAIEI